MAFNFGTGSAVQGGDITVTGSGVTKMVYGQSSLSGSSATITHQGNLRIVGSALFTNNVYLSGIASGSAAGVGSIVGVASNNKLVLTNPSVILSGSADAIASAVTTRTLTGSLRVSGTSPALFVTGNVSLGNGCSDQTTINSKLAVDCVSNFNAPITASNGLYMPNGAVGIGKTNWISGDGYTNQAWLAVSGSTHGGHAALPVVSITGSTIIEGPAGTKTIIKTQTTASNGLAINNLPTTAGTLLGIDTTDRVVKLAATADFTGTLNLSGTSPALTVTGSTLLGNGCSDNTIINSKLTVNCDAYFRSPVTSSVGTYFPNGKVGIGKYNNSNVGGAPELSISSSAGGNPIYPALSLTGGLMVESGADPGVQSVFKSKTLFTAPITASHGAFFPYGMVGVGKQSLKLDQLASPMFTVSGSTHGSNATIPVVTFTGSSIFESGEYAGTIGNPGCFMHIKTHITASNSLGITIPKGAAAAGVSQSNTTGTLSNQSIFDGVRKGTVTVTMQSGHSIAAGSSFVMSVVADQIKTTDVVLVGPVGTSAGHPMTAAAMGINSITGPQFYVGITNKHPATAITAGQTITFNWVLL